MKGLASKPSWNGRPLRRPQPAGSRRIIISKPAFGIFTDMESPIEKFQRLLRELFQFDCADLDFGIYRIMNHKRDAIERFIRETLPKTVAGELDPGL